MANALRFWQDVLLLPLPKYLQLDLIINAIINVVMLVVWKYLKHFYIFMLFLKIFARKLLNTANCKITPLPLPCFTCLNFYVNLKNRFPYCKKQSWKKENKKTKTKKKEHGCCYTQRKKKLQVFNSTNIKCLKLPRIMKVSYIQSFKLWKVVNVGKVSRNNLQDFPPPSFSTFNAGYSEFLKVWVGR